MVKSFTSWYALLRLFYLRFSSVSLHCSPVQFSFAIFMHLLMLFAYLYFSNPSGSKLFFLSSLPPFVAQIKNFCSGPVFVCVCFLTMFFKLVSWCFQPSQPQGITLRLNTNFNLSLSYWFHISLYHKSFFPPKTTTQILSTISERKIKTEKQLHMLWSLFIFRQHSTREPASSRVTYFILLAHAGTDVSHS